MNFSCFLHPRALLCAFLGNLLASLAAGTTQIDASDFVFDPMELDSPLTDASLQRARDRIANHRALLSTLKTPEALVSKLEEAELAFLQWDLERAKILWREVFSQHEDLFPNLQSREFDFRLQELAWLIWIADNESSPLPPSSWRYRTEASFVSKLPSKARNLIEEKKTEQSFPIDWASLNIKNIDWLKLNFEDQATNRSFSLLESEEAHLQVGKGHQVFIYSLSLRSGEFHLKERKTYSLWQSELIEKKSQTLLKDFPMDLNSRLILLRKSLRSGKREDIVVREAPTLSLASRREARHQPSALQKGLSSVYLEKEIENLFQDSSNIEEPSFPLLKNPWFWIGVGVIAGSVTAVTLHMNQRSVVKTP